MSETAVCNFCGAKTSDEVRRAREALARAQGDANVLRWALFAVSLALFASALSQTWRLFESKPERPTPVVSDRPALTDDEAIAYLCEGKHPARFEGQGFSIPDYHRFDAVGRYCRSRFAAPSTDGGLVPLGDITAPPLTSVPEPTLFLSPREGAEKNRAWCEREPEACAEWRRGTEVAR